MLKYYRTAVLSNIEFVGILLTICKCKRMYGGKEEVETKGRKEGNKGIQ